MVEAASTAEEVMAKAASTADKARIFFLSVLSPCSFLLFFAKNALHEERFCPLRWHGQRDKAGTARIGRKRLSGVHRRDPLQRARATSSKLIAESPSAGDVPTEPVMILRFIRKCAGERTGMNDAKGEMRWAVAR